MSELPLGAIIAFDFEKWDVREEIRLLHRAGAGRVQIYRNYLQGITAGHIRQTLEAEGFVIDSLHAYIDLEMFDGPAFDLSSPDPAVRRAAWEIARGEADYARDLGCRDVIVHPVGKGETEGDGRRRGFLAESAAVLAEIGAKAGIRFLIENMPPPMFGGDIPMLREVVDTVASSHVGLVFDSGHATIRGDPVGAIHAMGPRLWGVHLHDNDGKEDAHYLPGQGVVPFEDVCRALADVRYAGTFMLEIYRDTDEVDRDLTPERLAYIERLRRIASGLQ